MKSKPITPNLAAQAIDAPGGARPAMLIAGIALLLIALASSMALVLASLNALALPGCGEGSGCAEAAASAWGALPILNWPLSWVGAAWFGGLLIAFIIDRGRLPVAVRWIVRASTLGSVILVAVMIANGYLCKYCLAVHGANLGFWLVCELSQPRGDRIVRSGAALAGVFALVIASLFIIDMRTRADVQQRAETERQGSVQEILDAPSAERLAFTGRYHHGPEQAPMHIVMFTDYQCPDCYNIELQVERLFAERTDVSLSTKHFPFCPDCNHKVTRNLHPNACWAARAAEAAGRLAGNEAFWSTHFWLFRLKGKFDEPQLRAHLQTLGLDYNGFVLTMQSPEIDALIKADIDEAVSVGLHYTPMIFINGRELRGTATPNVLYRTIHELALQNPQPTPAALPASAREKFIEDWRGGQTHNFRTDLAPHARGSANPRLDIVVWGDRLHEQTGTLDREVRRIMQGRDDVRYDFRHFPVNSACNPHVPATALVHALSCDGARAVEAAGRLGGDDAWWGMHEWQIDHATALTADSFAAAAADLGLAPAALAAMMQDPEVAAAVQDDMDAGGLKRFSSVPAVFINGRYVPRIFLDDDCILDDIASEVLGEDFTP